MLMRAFRLAVLAALLPAPAVVAQPPDFLNFESGQTRPLALSPNGERFFAVNTPDARLEIFDLGDEGLVHAASVPVGLEPVAVAARTNGEVWVVNHLSDSVSIVDVVASTPRVVRTLLVGDEPRDLVFAGPARQRAFITTARRGQHRSHPSLAGVAGAGDPRFGEPGTPRADVWVFDAANLGDSLGGTPLAIVELFGDTPRALAASADGNVVYAAVFRSGNATATIPEEAVCDGFSATDEDDACPGEFSGSPGGLPGPATNAAGDPAPETGLIVRHDSTSDEWRDELGRDWSHAVRFDLPDLDVFAIDAQSLQEVAAHRRVGTVIYGLAVNPVNGRLYAANSEARNEVRFEGPGDFAASFGAGTVQGHLHEARITVIDPEAATIEPRHLNKHLDYDVRPAPNRLKRHSLSAPVALAVSSDGATLYAASLGSDRVGVYRLADLENDTFDPRRLSAGHLRVAGGPVGLALDEARGRLYVLTRFDNALAVIDLASGNELERHVLPNPEPPAIAAGRPLFYSARQGSSNGEASCAACHVEADFDGLAWDLGNPDAALTRSGLPILREDESRSHVPPINGSGEPRDFHPMKGPMTTQTLRGIAVSGAMQWRGDRSVGPAGEDPFSARVSLLNFADAFVTTQGRRQPAGPRQMELLADFLLGIAPPPNPVRGLDNTLPRGEEGLILFDFTNIDNEPAERRCGDCHIPNPVNGRYGTAGDQSYQRVPQIFKIPHLRNLYQKIGMFGAPSSDFYLPGTSDDHLGPQVRGFGFLHDGSVPTLFRYMRSINFVEDPADNRRGFRNDEERRILEEFLLGYDSDLAPIVGQQITLDEESPAAVRQRVDLLAQRASTPFSSLILDGVARECDLIVKGVIDGEARGGFFDPLFLAFQMDRESEPFRTLGALRQLAGEPGNSLTFTCVPPGSGRRMALDRDRDGFFDRDELDGGGDPADPRSLPGPPGDAVADPEVRFFGRVALGESVFREVGVRNEGEGFLFVDGFELRGNDRGEFFAVPGRDDCTGAILEPGEACSFRLRFTPASAGSKVAVAVVSSNEPGEGEVRIVLRGVADEP